MNLLTDGEIASMRSTLDESLPGTAVIQRKSLTADGQGGNSETWAAAGTVACRIAPVTSHGQDEGEGAGRTLQTADFTATFLAGTDVIAADRIISGGITYEVAKVNGPRSYELSRRVDVVVVS
jgi:head-tail adaptor